jgi:hypothetical protein
MTPHIPDPEVEANASATAAAVLEHPLARWLDWQQIWPVMAVRAGDPGIRPAQALGPALVATDAADIAFGLEIPA